MTETNLKRCPFCGGEAKCIEFYGLYHVICCNCHISGKDCPRRESAVSAWNTRKVEEEQAAEIARLLGNIETIKKIVDKPPLSIYDDARIYAQCCDALNGGNE